MTVTLAPSVRRACAVAILVAVALIAWHGVVGPVISTWDAYNDKINRTQALLIRYRELARAEPILQRQLNHLEHEKSGTDGFLTGGNANLVLAKLQSDVKGIIESHHGQVHSVQVLPVTDESGFKKLGVRFELNASLDDFIKVAYDLETKSPALFLDNIDIQSGEALAPNPAKAVPLTIRYDVYGYLRNSTP